MPQFVYIDSGVDPIWQAVFSQTLNADKNGYFTYCQRQLISSSLWSPSVSGGSQIRITFRAASGNPWNVEEAFIGEKAAAGDAYDFATTPTRITFSGANGFTITAGNALVSDAIPFVLDPTKDYIISWDNDDDGSPGSSMRALSTLSGATNYLKVTDGDAGTVDASGYSADATALFGIEKIEVFA